MHSGIYMAGSALIAGAALWLWPQPATSVSVATDAGHVMHTALSQPSANSTLDAAKGWVSGTTRRTAAQWDSWLIIESSLRGASLDGDWGEVGPQGLLPSMALRRRFDQLMTTIGELSPTELRAMVQALAERDLGPDATAVMAIWDRYVALTNAPLSVRPDPNNPQQWLVVLREQQAMRQNMLGADWASAFFAEEEAQLRATVAQLTSGAAPEASAPPAVWSAPPAGTSAADWQAQRQQALGPEAAARLAALDAEDSAWELRMDLARHAMRTLAIRAELSSLQRDQALQEWLDAHFKATEQVRVKALLGV
jgi:lipase chaperone LimK